MKDGRTKGRGKRKERGMKEGKGKEKKRETEGSGEERENARQYKGIWEGQSGRKDTKLGQ